MGSVMVYSPGPATHAAVPWMPGGGEDTVFDGVGFRDRAEGTAGLYGAAGADAWCEGPFPFAVEGLGGQAAADEVARKGAQTGERSLDTVEGAS